MPPLVAVVGAGVAGLSAAVALQRGGRRVVVLEGSDRVGGKVRVSDVGGLPVDEGADSMLRRVPEGVGLAADVGLGPELVSPAAGQAFLWTRGTLRGLPAGTVLGVPGDLASLARSGALTTRGLYRVLADLVPGDPVVDDVAVGELVGRRLGREVVERLVDPLLGGVYAGRADALSLQATLPQLVGPLASSARCSVPRGPPGPHAVDGPVFAGAAGRPGPAAPGRRDRARRAAGHHRHGRAADACRLAADDRHRAAACWRSTRWCSPSPQRLRPGCCATCCRQRAADLAALEYATVAIVTLVLEGPRRAGERLPRARRGGPHAPRP